MADIVLGSVVIDVNDLDGMRTFWQRALDYECELAREDWVKLVDPENRAATLALQKVPESKEGKNRIHVDLYCRDPEGAIAHLTSLGARIHPRTPEPDEDFVVLEDPEGNLFCVIDKAATGPA